MYGHQKNLWFNVHVGHCCVSWDLTVVKVRWDSNLKNKKTKNGLGNASGE